MFKVCHCQLIKALRHYRFYIGCIIGLSIILLNGTYLLDYSKNIGESVSIYDIYIYSSADRFAMFLCLLGVFVILSDLPFTDSEEIYVIIRTGKFSWVKGKILYLIVICTLYHLMLIIVTFCFSMPEGYYGNIWSIPLYNLAITDHYAGEQWGLYFPYHYLLTLFSPVTVLLFSFILNCLYSISLGVILFFFTLKYHYIFGFSSALGLHMLNYLIVRMGNSSLLKFSLFGNSIMAYHNYGRNYISKNFPSLIFSLLLFTIIITVTSIFCYYTLEQRSL